jgi:hypothetical protein
MPGSKNTCGTVEGFSRMLKVRPLVTLLMITAFVCSAQLASLYHHDSLAVHRDCRICKFLAVPSSGSEAAVLPISTPDFVHFFFALENLLLFIAVFPLVRGTRAPPQGHKWLRALRSNIYDTEVVVTLQNMNALRRS